MFSKVHLVHSQHNAIWRSPAFPKRLSLSAVFVHWRSNSVQTLCTGVSTLSKTDSLDAKCHKRDKKSDRFSSPGADSENLDFVAPPEEHKINGIFCLFSLPAFILKILSLSKCVRKTL